MIFVEAIDIEVTTFEKKIVGPGHVGFAEMMAAQDILHSAAVTRAARFSNKSCLRMGLWNVAR
jgi:hypothetical protein